MCPCFLGKLLVAADDFVYLHNAGKQRHNNDY